MKKTLGVVATAAAASLGSAGVVTPAEALPHNNPVGSVTVSMSGGIPDIYVRNSSGNSFNLKLEAMWGAGQTAVTTLGYLGPHGATSYPFGYTTSGGPIQWNYGPAFRAFAATGNPVTVNVAYRIVGAFGSVTSPWFHGAFPVSGPQEVVDWLGIYERTSTSQFRVANLFDPVPEPATILMLSAGLVGLGVTRRRRVRAAV
jgi:hypothetical protein